MKIRFHDCDPFSHLNNSRYIDYIITARGDQLLKNYNLDIYRLAKENSTGWVAAHTQISYLIPASVAEEVTVQTRLLDYSDKSLLLEGIMWNNDKTIVKAVLWTKLVHFNLISQKSDSHSEELMHLFGQVVNPTDEGNDFDKRIKDLKYRK